MEQLTTLSSLFLIIFVGFVLGRTKVLREDSVKTFNTLLFYVAIPSIVFTSLATMDKNQLELYPRFILINIIISVVSYIAVFVFLRIFVKSHAKRGGILFSSISGNVVYFGFPLLLNIYGQEHLNLGILFSIMVFAVVDLVGFLLISFDNDKKFNLVKELKEFVKNPIVIATFSGLSALIVGIEIPELIFDTLDNLSKGVTALGLITLGLFVSYNFKLNDIKLSLLTTFLKLIFVPAFTYLIVFHLIPLEQSLAQVSVVMAAMPAAVFSLTVADIYELDTRLVSSGIIISSILFLITSSVWIAIL